MYKLASSVLIANAKASQYQHPSPSGTQSSGPSGYMKSGRNSDGPNYFWHIDETPSGKYISSY